MKAQKIDAHTLLKHPKLWRAGELALQQSQSRQGTSSGYAALDQLLPDQGWPAAAHY
ncbi:MAG: hypothetical protein GKR90_04910 [Pseudomonadales bacterium]|nr:hypothetical protein [Pseudomonadales bacterium]